MRAVMGTRKETARRAALAAALGLGVALSLPAQAAPPAGGLDASSIVGDSALGDAHGVILLNQTAGDGNAQANSGAIALGSSAVAGLASRQRVEVTGKGRLDASARIQGQAFQDARGWLAVNQSAGEGNAQSNGLIIIKNNQVEALSDTQLAEVDVSSSDGTRTTADSKKGSRTVEMGKKAFSGAHGIIQVNQSAGRGNATGNRVHVHINGATAPQL